MWCDVQSPVMMGLQATANKRKLEYDSKCQQAPQPTKMVRLEDSVHEAAVASAVELDDWRLASTMLGGAQASPVQEEEDDEEDDDDEDEEEDKGEKYLPAGRSYQCLRYGSSPLVEGDSVCYQHPVSDIKSSGYYCDEPSSYTPPGSSPQYSTPQRLQPRYQPPVTARNGSQYWGSSEYYTQSAQQTIRCDENGKSYLDLGSSSARYPSSSVLRGPSSSAVASGGAKDSECCDGSGRTNWCGRGPDAACYRQRRLTVLNISMCKLGRYRQFPDPSLRRSVLICNTLRYIEREMEQEGFFFNGATGTVSPQNPPVPPPPAPTPHPAIEPEPSYHSQFPEVPAPSMNYPSTPYRAVAHSAEIVPQYEQNLRELSASGRATPFPTSSSTDYETDSGVGDEESGRSINWGSVLSLSSQSDLDPMNNNELYPSSPSHSSSSSSSSFGFGNGDSNSSFGLLGDVDLSHEFDDFLPSWKLTPLSADDILKSVPSSEFSARQGEGELDSIMHVLVGT